MAATLLHPRRFLSAHVIPLALAAIVLGPSPAADAGTCRYQYTSTAPTVVSLVGHDGAGTVDPKGEFQFTIRDLIGNIIPNSVVIVDFTACSDLRIAAVQPYTGMHTECASHSVWALTDGSGVARFRIAGRATNTGGSPGAGFRAVKIYVDGCRTWDRTAVAYDQDGANGVGANDLACWLVDYSRALLVGRSDYDGSGALGANDLSLWLSVYFGGGSTQGAALLPGGLCP